MTTEQARRDRLLAPIATSRCLGIPTRRIAHAMRQAGVDTRLDVKTAKRWRREPASAPPWFVALLAWKAARDAGREFRRQQASEEAALRDLTAEQTAKDKVLSGTRLRRFSDEELAWVDQWTWYLVKDRTPRAEWDEFERRVAKLAGL